MPVKPPDFNFEVLNFHRIFLLPDSGWLECEKSKIRDKHGERRSQSLELMARVMDRSKESGITANTFVANHTIDCHEPATEN